jgi:adenylate kinase family enzyme
MTAGFRRCERMQRIIILGNAGSGKSTLARRLGAYLALPVIHLDTLFWEAGWREPEAEVFRDRVRAAISGEKWICEGNYARRTLDLRLPRADVVIWLDTPRLVCVGRVVLRSAFQRNRVDLPAGCREKFDAAFLAFLRYVWNFDRQSRPGIEIERQKQAPLVPMVRLRNNRQISSFIASLR